MLKIRLKRAGRIRKPFYRLVLMENLAKRDGRAIVDLGYYDPLKKIINFDSKLYTNTSIMVLILQIQCAI